MDYKLDNKDQSKGSLPIAWNLKRLKDIAFLVTDRINVKRISLEDYVSTDNLLPNMGGKEKAAKLPSNGNVTRFEKGDILLSNIRPYFKKIWLSDNVGGCSNDVLVIRSKNEISNSYLYYCLQQDKFFDFVTQTSRGTKMPRGDKDAIFNFVFPIPPLNEQKAIAKILSDLDAKIELNQKMNKTIEAIAQAIFKHWFIDFEFPNEEGKPYKSSGGEMVDSELGEIPKGWEVKKLRDVLREISSGSRPKGGIDKKLCNGIPSIGAENINGLGHYDFSKTKYVTDGFFEKNQKGIVMDRDVLLYKDGAQLGRKTIFGGGFPFIKCMVNEHVFILRVREELRQSYLYFWLDRNDVTDAIRNLNTNSAQPGLNKEAVGSLRILVPLLHILSEFDLLISFLLNRIFNNSLQSKTIDEIRDLLLPKLVSGKIRVPLEE